MASIGLLLVGSAIVLAGPRLATAAWTRQAPRLGILMWQALTVSAVATAVLAGVTMLIPITMLAEDVGAIVHACAMSVAAAYGSYGSLPGRAIGTALAGAVPLWVLFCSARVLSSSLRSRARLRRSLALVSQPDPRLGVAVLETSAPAAFCLPGRGGRIVVSQGALDRLSPLELDGVLAHEEAHLRARHHLAVALSEILASAFPRVRLFQVATAETRQLIELLADDAAVQRVDRISVASAIVSLAEMKAPRAGLAMAQDATALRVGRLLSPAGPMTRWRYRLHAAGASAIAAAPLLIAGSPTAWAAVSDLCSI